MDQDLDLEVEKDDDFNADDGKLTTEPSGEKNNNLCIRN